MATGNKRILGTDDTRKREKNWEGWSRGRWADSRWIYGKYDWLRELCDQWHREELQITCRTQKHYNKKTSTHPNTSRAGQSQIKRVFWHLKVKYSGVIFSETLSSGHHSCQDPLVQSQRSNGSQEPAVTCTVNMNARFNRHVQTLKTYSRLPPGRP